MNLSRFFFVFFFLTSFSSVLFSSLLVFCSSRFAFTSFFISFSFDLFIFLISFFLNSFFFTTFTFFNLFEQQVPFLFWIKNSSTFHFLRACVTSFCPFVHRFVHLLSLFSLLVLSVYDFFFETRIWHFCISKSFLPFCWTSSQICMFLHVRPFSLSFFSFFVCIILFFGDILLFLFSFLNICFSYVSLFVVLFECISPFFLEILLEMEMDSHGGLKVTIRPTE